MTPAMLGSSCLDTAVASTGVGSSGGGSIAAGQWHQKYARSASNVRTQPGTHKGSPVDIVTYCTLACRVTRRVYAVAASAILGAK